MVYDRTCRGAARLPGLSHAWRTGGQLYRALGRLDACRGVATWDEALDWLAGVEPHRSIGEVQYWGHGNWGLARVDRQLFDLQALLAGHPLHAALSRVRGRMLPDAEGLWWFRTCETFGGAPGQRFATALADHLGCRVAGHTFVIGYWQSGLHSLLPGRAPSWSPDEGIAEGSGADPQVAHTSGPRKPNTITCLHGRVPAGY